jgi:hypothetical protein
MAIGPGHDPQEEELVTWPCPCTHYLSPVHVFTSITRREGKPRANEPTRVANFGALDLGPELRCSTAPVAIDEAVPDVLIEIDHELFAIAAFVNGAAAEEL